MPSGWQIAKPQPSLPGTGGLRRPGCWDGILAKGQVALHSGQAAASARGQTLRKAEKTWLAEVTRPLPSVLGGRDGPVFP